MTSFSSAIFHIVSSKQREDAKWLNVSQKSFCGHGELDRLSYLVR